jgi:hypothetical protein
MVMMSSSHQSLLFTTSTTAFKAIRMNKNQLLHIFGERKGMAGNLVWPIIDVVHRSTK